MATPTTDLTPMQRQYRAMKEKHQDCILFFRLGDFYEMFNEDAFLAARELDIGTCILGIFDAGAAGRLLELEGLRPACLIAMGYPEQWKNGPGRKETEELLSFR